MDRLGQDFGVWVTQNLGTIMVIAGIIALIMIALLLVGFVAQGGMATATADLARGRSISAGQAWSAGLRLFWRYLLLWLSVIGLSIAIVLVVVIMAGIIFLLAGAAEGAARVLLIVIGVLIGLALVVAMIAAFLGLGIVATYAQRAIAVENVGPIAALESGGRLLRRNLGTSLLVWLIGLGLGIGAGIAVMIGLVVAMIPLGIVGVILFTAGGGITSALIAFGVLAALVFIAVAWLLNAIVNTFFWNYWTLTYLTLSGQISGPMASSTGP